MSTTVPCILRSHTVLPLSFLKPRVNPFFILSDGACRMLTGP
jgi:hypothetical protein